MEHRLRESLSERGLRTNLVVTANEGQLASAIETALHRRIPASAVALLFEEQSRHSSLTLRVLHSRFPQG